MPRLLTLGWLLLPVAAAPAADPVLYPTTPGNLSQSLPNLVSGALSTVPTVPPPVMVSQPGWGGSAYGGLGCPTPVCAPAPACAVRQPLIVPQVHRLPVPLATECGARGSLLERLRAWLCGGAGPVVAAGPVFAPPVVPLRDWGWKDTVICGSAAAASGWPSKCDARGGRLFPMGRAFGGSSDSCPAGVPAACPTTFGPRPVHIPLASAYDRSANCNQPRPGLLRRLLAFLSPEWFGCEPACDNIVPYSAYSYGGGLGTQCATPLVQGTPLAASLPVIGQPVATTTRPVAAQPAPVQAGVSGGYHFATSEVKPVSVVPTATVTPVLRTPTFPNAVVPASATQPLTRQR